MKKPWILTRLYGVTPTIVLRRNIIKARHVTQQDYGSGISTSSVLALVQEVTNVITGCVFPVRSTMAGVGINTLTMEQYLALSRENQASGVVKPEIRGNVNFEIKSQFMPELREDTFFGNKNEDAHDHVDRV
ncbi:hypothetical protein Tco_1211783 [Tanacetum coccineum]